MSESDYIQMKHHILWRDTFSLPGETNWRLIDTEYDDPVFNLAVEEAIMENVGEGKAPNTIRMWVNPRPTAVIGRYQIPELEVNEEACKKHGVKVVRRFTGGGTVYHDKGNLNYAISVRRSNPLIPLTIDRIRPTLCSGIVEALRMLGLDAKFEPRGAYIHVDGMKVSGTAGAVKRTTVFLHGTLLINSDLARLREILDVQPYPEDLGPKQFVKSRRKEVTSLKEQMGEDVPLERVKKAIKRGFAKALGIQLQHGELLPSEIELANNIATNRTNEINVF